MNKTLRDRLLRLCLVALGIALTLRYVGGFSREDTTISPESVLEITYPSNNRSGGTGFVVEAPSGKLYTLTNRHVCRGNEGGFVSARLKDSKRYILLRVIEQSAESDLCILTPFPNVKGFRVGKMPSWGQGVTLVGHPLLMPITRVSGEIYEEGLLDLIIGLDLDDELCQKEGGVTQKQMTMFGDIIKVCTRSYYANRTSLIAYPGNSGSPIVDSNGEVVSVLFAGDNRTNWGYGVPHFDIVKFLSIY